jgi:predicted nucleic-acid-binding protein
VKKYIIDINALISFVTDRNPDQQEKIASFFEQAAQIKVFLFVHQHTLTEFIFVMEKVYSIPKKEIAHMVSDLIAMPGIEVVNHIDFSLVLSWWPEPVPDFGDAVIASVCKNIKGSIVVTFDRKFMERLKALKLNYQIF